MEWRCAWCGKPHESDDPPCDNCGHNKFEKAVERVPATGKPQGSVWVCPECGRQHQKHSPPCSRCGNLTLQQRDVSELGDPLADIGTRWRDVVEPRYVLGYLAVGILLIVLGLGARGVVDVPGFGEPNVPDAPGSGETASNLSLDDVEYEYAMAVNERRRNVSVDPLTTDDALGRLAAYYNKAIVLATYGEGEGPNRDALDRFDTGCSGTATLVYADALSRASGDGPIIDAGTPDAVVTAFLSTIEENGVHEDLLRPELTEIGVDVHVGRDDRVFVTVAVC